MIYFIHFCLIVSCKYVDIVQQAFLLNVETTLHLVVPALETLYKAWSSLARWLKHAHFELALDAAADKIDEYYEKTTKTPVYIMAMSLSIYLLHTL